jgi:hypothetical protein
MILPHLGALLDTRNYWLSAAIIFCLGLLPVQTLSQRDQELS